MSAVCLWCMVASLFSLSMQARSQQHSLPWLPDKTWALSRRLVPGPRQGSPNDCNKKKKSKKETNANDYLGGSLLVRNLSLSLWLSGWIVAIVCGHGASGKINTGWADAVQQQRNNNNTIICYGCRGERAALPTNGGFALAHAGAAKRRAHVKDMQGGCLGLPVRHTVTLRVNLVSTAISTATVILRLIGGYKIVKYLRCCARSSSRTLSSNSSLFCCFSLPK